MSRHLLHLVAVLALASISTSSSGASSKQVLELKVLTFNVWHGLRSGESRLRFPGEGRERRARRFDWQIEEIRRIDPDVLLLQEVNPNQRQARRYAAALGYDEIHKVTSCGLHLGVFLKIPLNVNDGLAILARPELGLRRRDAKRLSGNAMCSATWGFQTRESRYMLTGEIELAGQSVLLVTTHLSSPPLVHEDFEPNLESLTERGILHQTQRSEILAVLEAKRARNFDEVEALLAEIERRRPFGRDGASVPVILGGDFNTEPETAGIEALRGAGFSLAAEGPEFHTWDPVTNHLNCEIGTARENPLPTFGVPEIERLLAVRFTTPRQIDFILVSEGIAVRSAERVLDQERDGLYPSDHFGILARLQLSPR